MPKPEKLYTFADLREVVPLSESKLRQVLAESSAWGAGRAGGCCSTATISPG